jgi:hypothetical protein
MFQIIRKLILELPIPNRGPSSSVPERIPRLYHKLGDNTVEDNTLKVATASVSDKVFDRFWCLLWKQSYMNISNGRVDCS